MELIDRYLFAVGRYLPKERRDDILAELRANILAMAEDREQELGRPLNLDEEEAVLKQHGHPMMVAARYLPQQHLIGPAVFPFYWYVMKTALPWVALFYVLAHMAGFFFEPITLGRIIEVVLQFVPVVFYTFGWITLVFAAMEFATARYMKDSKVLYAWRPRKLPNPEPEAPKERRSNPIFDFIGSLFGLAFLLVIRAHPFIFFGPAAYYLKTLRPAPVWYTAYSVAIVFVSIQLVMKFIAIFSPKVRGWRIAIDLVTKASAIGIMAIFVRTHEYLLLGTGDDAAKFQEVVRAINLAMSVGFRVVIVILSIQLVWEIGKLIFPSWQHARASLLVM